MYQRSMLDPSCWMLQATSNPCAMPFHDMIICIQIKIFILVTDSVTLNEHRSFRSDMFSNTSTHLKSPGEFSSNSNT